MAIAMRTLFAFAHADVANANGDTFVGVLRRARGRLRVKPYVLVPEVRSVSSLQCLCARKLRSSKRQYANWLPSDLVRFIDLH